jgi:hypothetical protein
MVLRGRMSQKPSQRRRPPYAAVRTGDDGIHRLTETIRQLPRPARDGAPVDEAWELRETRRALITATATLEAELKPYLRVLPRFDPTADDAMWPDLRWYAAQVHRLRDRIEDIVREHPGAELGVVFALRLATLVTDAHWRIDQGDRVRRTIRRVEKNRAAGKAEKSPRENPEHHALQQRVKRLRERGLGDRAIRKEISRGRAHDDKQARDAFRQKVNRILKKLDA